MVTATTVDSAQLRDRDADTPWPLIVALTVLVPEVISLVSQLLQRSRIGSPVPSELQGIYEDEEYALSNEYTKAKSTFSLLKDVFDLAVLLAFWFLRGFPWVDSLCTSLHVNEILTGLACIALISFAQAILDLPWDVYRTFVLEERFGFNKTTPLTFVKDRLKGLVLGAAIGVPLLAVVLWFFVATGSHGWLWVFLTVTAFQVVLMFLMPVLILPLFLEMIPLPEGVALITGEIGKQDSLAFVSSRVFYEHEKPLNGKPSFITKDRRFAGAKAGATLSIHWAVDGAGGVESRSQWVMAEGEPGSGGVVYAVSSSPEAPRAGDSTEWSLTQEAKAMAVQEAGSGAGRSQGVTEPLVKDCVVASCIDVGTLRRKLLELANRLEYTGANIFVIDGSSRSAHSNAFCIGFGRFRRICLFDTLLPLMEESEIIAVLGHEIGHDRLYHVHTRLVLSIAYMFIMLYAMGQFLVSPAISAAFFVPKPKVYLGIMLFGIVWSIIDFAVSIPLTVQSRMNEFAADRYSIDADKTYAKGLGDGLKKLMRKSKANLTPHPFYAFLTYSHPPLDIRLRAIREYHEKKYG